MKTDRRDAEHLARLLLAGKLSPVRVPGTDQEALRDLVRAREDLRGDLMRARHRLSKLLLRHGLRYEGKTAWSGRSGLRPTREGIRGTSMSSATRGVARCSLLDSGPHNQTRSCGFPDPRISV